MSVCKEVSKEELGRIKERFYLKDGELYYTKPHPKKGDKPAVEQKVRYKMVWSGTRTHPYHRVVYFLANGVWPLGVVDHIDGNTHNNHPDNLRLISQGENTRSYSPAHRDSSSKFRGVSWYPRYNKWEVSIMGEGKKFYLGRFSCEKEAAMAWNKKAIELGFNPEALNKVG